MRGFHFITSGIQARVLTADTDLMDDFCLPTRITNVSNIDLIIIIKSMVSNQRS